MGLSHPFRIHYTPLSLCEKCTFGIVAISTPPGPSPSSHLLPPRRIIDGVEMVPLCNIRVRG